MCARPIAGLSDLTFVERIVAGPGDRVSLRRGLVIRNGRRENGRRGCNGAECDLPQEITVAPEHWLVLGDNRGASDDSRFWGPVPTEAFIGRHLWTYKQG